MRLDLVVVPPTLDRCVNVTVEADDMQSVHDIARNIAQIPDGEVFPANHDGAVQFRQRTARLAPRMPNLNGHNRPFWRTPQRLMEMASNREFFTSEPDPSSMTATN